MAIESQFDQRRPATFYDHHGRPWHASVEKSTGEPVGLLEPLFAAPWIPPQSAVRTIPDQPGKLTIDYDKLIAEREEALLEWNRETVRLGRELYGSQFEVNGDLPPELRQIVGKPPESVVPILAAKQGKSRWILYGEGHMPKWAEPFFRLETREAATYGDVEYTDDEPAEAPAPKRGKPAEKAAV